MLNRILKRIFSAVYPERCPYCGEIINYGRSCCDSCNKTVNRCLERTKVYEDSNGKLKSYCFTPLKYEGSVKQAIWRYKFRGCKSYAVHFADEIIRGLNDTYYKLDFDVITFVPMFKKRKRERGYNQSEILAKEIGRKLRVKCNSVLVKVKDNKPQHNLDYLERIENVKGIYSLESKDLVKGKKILVCDDVITTGSTLRECCKILYDAGAASVECAAIAHTVLD